MKISEAALRAPSSIRFRLSKLRMALYRGAFAAIGEGTVILPPQMLVGVDRIQLGSNVLIRDGAWLAVEGPAGQISIGSNSYFGHRLHIHSIDPVCLGSGIVVADNVMITSTDHGRKNRHEVHGTGSVVVGDNVFLGQNAVVLGGVTIGDGATVAAGAVVVSDVSPGAVVGGVPAKPLGGLSA